MNLATRWTSAALFRGFNFKYSPFYLYNAFPSRSFNVQPIARLSRAFSYEQKNTVFKRDSYILLRPRLVHNATMLDRYFYQLVRLRESQKYALALAVVDTEMKTTGVLPDARIWRFYLRICEETRQPERAESALRHMREQGFAIDALHYSSLLSVMASTGRVNRVNELLAELRAKQIPLDRNIYTLIISGFASNRLYDEMFKYYDAMKAANIRPDYITFTVLLKAVCRFGAAEDPSVSRQAGAEGAITNAEERLVAIVKDLFDSGHEMAEIHRLLLQGFGASMRADAALSAADRIAQVVPDFNVSGFLRTVLKHWTDKRDAPRAYVVLKKLRVHDPKSAPSLRSEYEKLFNLFRDRNEAQAAQSVLHDYQGLGGSLSPQMILGSMELAINYNDIKQALKLLEEIEKNSIIPSAQIAKNLLRLCWRFGREAPAKTAIAYFKKCLAAAAWREIEALIVTENMGHLLPK